METSIDVLFGPDIFYSTLQEDSKFKESPLSSLPKEIVLNIFGNLGINDMANARALCKCLKKSGDELLKVAVKELNIPLQESDDMDFIIFLLKKQKIYEIITLSDFYEISDDQKTIIVKKNFTVEDRKNVKEQLKLLENKYPNHTDLKQLDLKGIANIIDYQSSKYPNFTSFVNIVGSAMQKLPPGSWASCFASLSCPYIMMLVKEDNGTVSYFTISADSNPCDGLDPNKEVEVDFNFVKK